MVLGIVLLVVALGIIGMFVRSRSWKVLLSATSSNAEQVEAMFFHLKSNGVKCKLVTDAGPVGATSYMHANDVMPSPVGSVIRLKVHQKHLELAKNLMESHEEAV